MSTPLLATYYLPISVQRQMSGLDHVIVNYMCSIFNPRKEVIAYDKAGITPAQDTIAKAVNSSGSVVSKCLKHISKLNIFQIIHRRKTNGEFTINTYLLGDVFLRMLRLYYGKKKPNKNHHLLKRSTIVNKDQDKDNYFQHIGYILDVVRGKKKVEEVIEIGKHL